jgi:hypothetical protein
MQPVAAGDARGAVACGRAVVDVPLEPNAALVALRKSGIKFRTIVHEDGRVERWKEPRVSILRQSRGL